LLSQLGNARRQCVHLRVRGVIDSTGYVLSSDGLTRAALDDIRRLKAAGRPLSSHALGRPAAPINALGYVVSQLRGRSLLVDTSAVDTHDMLAMVLERGWDVVLANKIPVAGEQARVDHLRALARASGARILHEATVGAGLPVLDTLRKLREAGDRVLSIEGCPSGTLGFVFGAMGEGRPFADALRDAIAAGLTEPDPRADLSGLDVARKALILARAIGYRGGLESVAIESLVPPQLSEVPLPVFLERAAELNDAWAARVGSARAQGAVIRYRVRVTRRSVRVGLATVALTDPVSLLQGTDNQFSFTTSRYSERPLVIAGPGAGAQVTAGGVYNDVMRIATERRARPRSASLLPAYGGPEVPPVHTAGAGEVMS
jgi:aspartokinase/homoserine dehydrogenase 1